MVASLDGRVKKVIANCPVVDWAILAKEERLETSNPNYAAYIREAFGNGYRLTDSNWRKLHGGKFYNPAHHVKEINPAKIMMFHAKDDPYVPYKSVKKFADQTGVKLNSLARGGHVTPLADDTLREKRVTVVREGQASAEDIALAPVSDGTRNRCPIIQGTALSLKGCRPATALLAILPCPFRRP